LLLGAGLFLLVVVGLGGVGRTEQPFAKGLSRHSLPVWAAVAGLTDMAAAIKEIVMMRAVRLLVVIVSSCYGFIPSYLHGSSGNFATLIAILRASSLLSNFAAERRLGSLS